VSERYCRRCGEALLGVAYVVVNDDPNYRGLYHSECCPWGVVVEPEPLLSGLFKGLLGWKS